MRFWCVVYQVVSAGLFTVTLPEASAGRFQVVSSTMVLTGSAPQVVSCGDARRLVAAAGRSAAAVRARVQIKRRVRRFTMIPFYRIVLGTITGRLPGCACCSVPCCEPLLVSVSGSRSGPAVGRVRSTGAGGRPTGSLP